MTEERARRLRQFWNWLPAFRAVAETEHLPSAAAQVGVTPSALSRSIKDLEGAVGVRLFERRGRGLVLNRRGMLLLESLRDSMRILDDGVDRVLDEVMAGPVRIAAPGPFLGAYVAPVVRRLRDTHPDVAPSLESCSAAEANARLLDGRLDVALLDDPIRHPRLATLPLGALSYGVYAAPGHPLAARRRLGEGQLAAHPFVAPPDRGDHWPVGWARTVAVECQQLQVGMELCATAGLLALLPDGVAARYAGPGRLTRLAVRVPTQASLYAVRREALGASPLVDWTVEALAEEVRAGAP